MINSYRTVGPQTQCGTYLIFFAQDDRTDGGIAGPTIHLDDIRELEQAVSDLQNKVADRTGFPVIHTAVNRIHCNHD